MRTTRGRGGYLSHAELWLQMIGRGECLDGRGVKMRAHSAYAARLHVQTVAICSGVGSVCRVIALVTVI